MRLSEALVILCILLLSFLVMGVFFSPPCLIPGHCPQKSFTALYVKMGKRHDRTVLSMLDEVKKL